MDFENLDSEQLSDDQQQQMLFMMLVQQHQQIAMMGMGKIKNPSTDEIERDLKSAKFAIDTLLMLQDYTEGNLPDKLKGYLKNTLSTLQLNYAEEQDEENKETKESE
ncbi:MAG TPA: DUF1844 domain-containing protein [Balneolaceae bacterium]|nr:DUF1844 domain-containing protein [Balneolaceae bacterium]